MNTDEPINPTTLDRLLELICGDIEDVQELVQAFEQSTPDPVNPMRAAVAKAAQQDRPGLAGRDVALLLLSSATRRSPL